jgi:hypothetical protein
MKLEELPEKMKLNLMLHILMSFIPLIQTTFLLKLEIE